MRTTIVLLLLLVAAPVAAQTCAPTYMVQSTYWSDDPMSLIIPDSNRAHIFTQPVPAGQVWKMRSISLSTKDGNAREYMIEWLVAVPGGNHYHEIARGSAAGTPALHVAPADAAAMILQPGERLAGRVNGDPSTFPGIALYFSGWSFPVTCLARLLGAEAPATGTAPDLSSLVQAATAAATALEALAGSVP
jgi:hypothetical protein